MVFKTPKYTEGNEMNPKQSEREKYWQKLKFSIQTLINFVSYFGIIIQIIHTLC